MPNIFDYNPQNIHPFPYWKWNKVLPAVYDDSLSQYELLCKLLDIVNNIITSTNSTGEQVEQLTQLVQQLIDGEFPSGIVQYVTDIAEAAVADDFATVNARIAAIEADIANLENNYQLEDNFILIGDSYGTDRIADGEEVTGWCQLVKWVLEHYGHSVYVNAVGGYGFGIDANFADLLSRAIINLTTLQRQSITKIYIAGGANDLVSSFSTVKLADALNQINTLISRYLPNVKAVYIDFIGVIKTPRSGGAWNGVTMSTIMSRYNDVITYAGNRNFVVVTDGIGVLRCDSYFTSDGVHPHNAGQLELRNHIVDTILGAGSGIRKSPTSQIMITSTHPGYNESKPLANVYNTQNGIEVKFGRGPYRFENFYLSSDYVCNGADIRTIEYNTSPSAAFQFAGGIDVDCYAIVLDTDRTKLHGTLTFKDGNIQIVLVGINSTGQYYTLTTGNTVLFFLNGTNLYSHAS